MRVCNSEAGCWWLMPVRRLLSGGLWFKASPGKELKRLKLTKKKYQIKVQLEWLMV
jgi:hypothetical protein